MVDSLRHQGKRKQLVKLLEQKGIEDKAVLEAVGRIPRHLFLDSAFEHFAYEDEAFPIGSGQTISHPFTVAFQTQLLQIEKRDSVLEVGTGSGYQTAVLVTMGAQVYSIERQKSLFDKTRRLLSKLGFKPRYLSFGDGYKGLPAFAEFDKIIVTAGATDVPEKLLLQLKVGGIMVVPLGDSENQVMTVFLKLDNENFERHTFGDFKFVPMLESKVKEI